MKETKVGTSQVNFIRYKWHKIIRYAYRRQTSFHNNFEYNQQKFDWNNFSKSLLPFRIIIVYTDMKI